MTSEIDVSKTNEFQRRRKLRLQQVREQSKDIAKKIRQRAKVEKLQHVINLDGKKEKDYFALQEKLVSRLEHLYSQSLQNVGASHKNASNLKESDKEVKNDPSKLRGREAVAELRKRKQEKLDEQKKILDRKLQAREAANELSREKCALLTKTLSSKSVDNLETHNINSDNIEEEINKDRPKDIEDTDITKNDMGTQWEGDEFPNEWAPSVPTLLLPKDDKDSLKDTGNDKEKSDSNKKINLFALSDEMPSSLRGGLSSAPMDVPPHKPSMTLVSEYLQSRSLRLRENEPITISAKKSDDLQSIKQTILRSRSSRPDVSAKSDKSKSALDRKKSVTIYNHSSRDTRDVLYNNERHVIRESNTTSEDAYTSALKETSMFHDAENKELERKKEEMRNRVAVTREKVDKEYKDTLSFLNSLSKDTTSRPQKIAHMDSGRQKMQNEKRQRKLQEEFRKIERECSKRNCKHSKNSTSFNTSRSKSKSPDRFNNNVLPRNFQYDWMPVPEGDGKLTVHTIPSMANQKSSNSVKFNDVDTYHEYRSRHRHTPPTKDGCKDTERKRIETVVIEHDNESTDRSSVISDASSLEHIDNNKNKDFLDDHRLSDGDRIVIYKILDSKKKCRAGKKAIAINKIFKSVSSTDKGNVSGNIEETSDTVGDKSSRDKHVQSDLENLNEGIYKVGENGVSYNITSCYTANVEMWQTSTERKPWWDNIASIYFTESNQDTNTSKGPDLTRSQQGSIHTKCMRNSCGLEQIPNECGVFQSRNQHSCTGCKCGSLSTNHPQTLGATSTSSFQTATNDKAANVMSDGGFLKLFDEGGQQDAGKFYIGASGFLKDDNYEVVIQLKKKETEKIESISQKVNVNVVDDLPSKDVSKVDTEVQSSVHNNLKETSAQTSFNKECTIVDENIPNSNSESGLVILPTEKPSNAKNCANDKENSKKSETAFDKSVHTSFHDSFAIPTNVAKTDPVSRPATSAYTQTSFSSPNSRPVFMHMTSSTSTAYMSPPELIVPRFLKHSRTLSHDNVTQINEHYNEFKEQGFIKQNQKCKWKHSRSISTQKFSKCRHICSTTDTPPNTAHSYDYNGSWSENIESEKLTQKVHSKRCRKSRKYKNNFTLHKSSSKVRHENYPTAVLSNKNTHKLSHTRHFSSNKNNFNPVVKQYVNKLLSLNKESLKAIQIINQDCSTVVTPGSSIINNDLNIDDNFLPLQNKISLEEIKIMLEKRIMEEQAKKQNNCFEMQSKNILKLPRRKQMHKVKSLNISRRILKNKHSQDMQRPWKGHVNKLTKPESSSSSTKDISLPKQLHFYKDESDIVDTRTKNRSKSSPTLRRTKYRHASDSNITKPTIRKEENAAQPIPYYSSEGTHIHKKNYKSLRSNRASITPMSSDSERRGKSTKNTSQILPTDISTQTSGIDSEINFMKLAEDKLQNMEKIADLTEKCTKRLSNLAKVLEEVRRNKSSLVYSHISTSDSTSESEPKKTKSNENTQQILQSEDTLEKLPTLDLPENEDREYNYVPLLKDIPKPLTPSTLSLSTISEKSNIATTMSSTDLTKSKAKPPPALTRVNLKNVQNFYTVPHELSTVIEVDSPMSIKQKNQSSRREISQDILSKPNVNVEEKQLNTKDETHQNYDAGLDLVDSKPNSFKLQSSSDSADNPKLQMMDMKLFNDIMLKPFVSLQDYAKQCDVRIEEGSNIEEVFKDDHIQEELSSLHSDGSLPDVISELLKRKIITEPFKFDTGSHANTTSISSESSLSLLALSKIHKERKKANKFSINKENMAETSETLSMSSNPDLENAFQKLGMGWASSTLKKTKERLALSSSSNTSSSSLSHLKFKSFNKDIPTMNTESTTSDHNDSNKSRPSKNVIDSIKNAEQQTSLINSMTVKEFLTNELAKKITFNNKSNKGDEEFVSLYETKMPEEIKNITEMCEEDRSIANQSNIRARTSTPVQIFKSTTYQSTSSTNTSNGLFSNADELSSVKVTSTSIRNHSTSDKDDLTIPNYSLKIKGLSDSSKSE